MDDLTNSKDDKSDRLKLLEYEYKLVQLKYDNELRREDSLIQQSGRMQTTFSFCMAALFMIIPIAIEYRGVLSLYFFLIAASSIVVLLLFSLFMATMAQNRRMRASLPDGKEQMDYIEKNQEKFKSDEQKQKYLNDTISELQYSLAQDCKKRVTRIQWSMRSFYGALGLCVFWFIVAICKII